MSEALCDFLYSLEAGGDLGFLGDNVPPLETQSGAGGAFDLALKKPEPRGRHTFRLSTQPATGKKHKPPKTKKEANPADTTLLRSIQQRKQAALRLGTGAALTPEMKRDKRNGVEVALVDESQIKQPKAHLLYKSKRADPPPVLLDLVDDFLGEWGFEKAVHGIRLEMQKRERVTKFGHAIWKGCAGHRAKLVDMWEHFEREHPSKGVKVDGKQQTNGDVEIRAKKGKKTKEETVRNGKQASTIPESNLSEPPSESSNDDSEDEGSLDSDAEFEKNMVVAATKKPATPAPTPAAGLKRKASSSASSSSESDPGSNSSSSSGSSSKEQHESKKPKLGVNRSMMNGKKAVSRGKDSSSSSSDDSSSSTSSSDSDSDSDSKRIDTKATASSRAHSTKKVASSSSKSSSASLSSSSSSDEEGPSSALKQAHRTVTAPSAVAAATTVPIAPTSGAPASSKDTLLVPAQTVSNSSTHGKRKRGDLTTTTLPATAVPATEANLQQLKRQNIPFSRIPADQYVDPKLSSNKYVPYDYADAAHRDLVVTKGKGFTKEKNKKKRGSYRGGIIDTMGGKGIKFED